MPMPDNEAVDSNESGSDIDPGRRAALVKSLKTAAYMAPATLMALTMQAHATSADG